MPPNPEVTGILFENEGLDLEHSSYNGIGTHFKADNRKLQLVWRNIILFSYLHLAGLYGAYLFLTSAMWSTDVFAFFLYVISGLGLTAGAHRLWSHRSFKAKTPLKVMLLIFNLIAFQDSAIDWARDHRLHHKYSETDADPYNATRGFFFSHVGWLLCKKHPEIKAKGHTIDNGDLYSDPLLMFQKKYYLLLMPIFCFILPTVIPMYFWGESFSNAWFVATMFRYTYVLNGTWCVNSAAHKFGNKPYNRHIKPVENKWVSSFVLGEGFHNYHHTFPWDYKTAELGGYSMNVTKAFLDFMAYIGWAYDLKTASKDLIERRAKRSGDGSHNVWGWGDSDQPKEERDGAIIYNRSYQAFMEAKSF